MIQPDISGFKFTSLIGVWGYPREGIEQAKRRGVSGRALWLTSTDGAVFGLKSVAFFTTFALAVAAYEAYLEEIGGDLTSVIETNGEAHLGVKVHNVVKMRMTAVQSVAGAYVTPGATVRLECMWSLEDRDYV